MAVMNFNDLCKKVAEDNNMKNITAIGNVETTTFLKTYREVMDEHLRESICFKKGRDIDENAYYYEVIDFKDFKHYFISIFTEDFTKTNVTTIESIFFYNEHSLNNFSYRVKRKVWREISLNDTIKEEDNILIKEAYLMLSYYCFEEFKLHSLGIHCIDRILFWMKSYFSSVISILNSSFVFNIYDNIGGKALNLKSSTIIERNYSFLDTFLESSFVNLEVKSDDLISFIPIILGEEEVPKPFLYREDNLNEGSISYNNLLLLLKDTKYINKTITNFTNNVFPPFHTHVEVKDIFTLMNERDIINSKVKLTYSDYDIERVLINIKRILFNNLRENDKTIKELTSYPGFCQEIINYSHKVIEGIVISYEDYFKLPISKLMRATIME